MTDSTREQAIEKVAKLRAELADANLDREYADEARKRAYEISDAANEAHRKTLERTRRVVKERDRAVADLAALQDRVRGLAEEFEAGDDPLPWAADKLSALLGDQ